jgi:hypothetical protein
LPFRAALAALWLAFATAPAAADPGYYVVTAYPEQGARWVEARYWTVKPNTGGEVVWPEVGLGAGLTSRWTAVVFASFIGPSDLRTRLSTLNWQNEVLLTQGEWPVDIALHLQGIRDPNSNFSAVEFGPVLQTDLGRTQLNANVFLERGWFAGSWLPTEMKYQWQVRHRWQRGLHVGAQGFGELGPWNDWVPSSRQSHRAGPAVFAEWPGAGAQPLQIQGAWLWGRTYGQSGHMATIRMALRF